MPENHSTPERKAASEGRSREETSDVDASQATFPQQLYRLNKEQLDKFAGISWLTSFFFTLAGITGGGSISCWLGRLQTGLPPTLEAQINLAFWFFVILTVLFFPLVIVKQVTL